MTRTPRLAASAYGLGRSGGILEFALSRTGRGGYLLVLLSGLGAVLAFGAQLGGHLESEYVVASWETIEGLPENSATSIAQTPDGYLWIGTFNGLVRFNGADFTVFNPANTPQLTSEGIVNLHADRRGRLWISTFEGLVVLDGRDWRRCAPADGWTGDVVRTFTERADGALLITTFNGRLFEHKDGRFTELPSPPGEAGQGYFGSVDEEGFWWVVQNQFIGRWEDGRWVSQVVPPELARYAVGCAPARDGGIWLLLGRELRKVRGGLEVARVALTESPGGVWSLSEDSRTNIWIATYNRGFCRVSLDGTMSCWNRANGAADNGRCVFEDRERNLWLGTSGGGLLRLTSKRFQHYALAEGGRGAPVQSVSPHPGGGVWAASYGLGLFHVTDAGATNVPLLGPPNDTPYLQSVLADREDRLWVGTITTFGLRLVDRNGTRILPDEEIGVGNLIALFEDSRGHVWMSGGGTNITRWDGVEFEAFGAGDGVPGGGIMGFAEDAAGTLWGWNRRGFYRQDEKGRFVEIKDTADQPISDLTCLYVGTDGAMWLGSSNRGLLRWKNDTLTQLDARAKWPIALVQGIAQDDDGYLWLTSGYRLVRAHLQSLQAAADGRSDRIDYQVFDTHDGLPRTSFTGGRQPGSACYSQGRLWFGTTKGVVSVDPATLQLNREAPPVHVESLSYYHPAPTASRPRAGGPGASEIQSEVVGPFDGPVVLPPGSERLEIHYAGLSYTAPEKVRFEMKLEGWDLDWRDAEDSRLARFHELRPGDYVFRVRAANNDGVWNEAGASLAFTVLPHYWQTGWFWVGIALLLVGLGAALTWRQFRIHVRRAQERERAALEIRDLAGRLINAQEDERRRIARELHDDFSQSLALLSVEMELFGAATPAAEPGGAPKLLQMAARVKELSSEVHQMAHQLHPAKLDQLGLVSAVRGFCRELSGQSGLHIEFKASTFPRDIPPELALCLYRIIQESLHNVSRHSGAETARVELGADPDRLYLTVADSGRGFNVKRAQREGGLGLSSMRERVRPLQGTLRVTSSPGQGTRVEASLPLGGAKETGQSG